MDWNGGFFFTISLRRATFKMEYEELKATGCGMDGCEESQPSSFWRKSLLIWKAPVVKFTLDLLCVVLLLGLNFYMTLEAFSSTVQPYEIVLAVWMALLGIEEYRQVR